MKGSPVADQSYPVELTAPDISAYRHANTGVDYVTSFESGVAGPHVMINAVTHGNEICGVIALDHLLRHDVRPVRGRLTLGFVNHEAYGNFDPAAPEGSRFVDEDFDRVWSRTASMARKTRWNYAARASFGRFSTASIVCWTSIRWAPIPRH